MQAQQMQEGNNCLECNAHPLKEVKYTLLYNYNKTHFYPLKCKRSLTKGRAVETEFNYYTGACQQNKWINKQTRAELVKYKKVHKKIDLKMLPLIWLLFCTLIQENLWGYLWLNQQNG